MIARPEPGEYAEPFAKYVQRVPAGDIRSLLAEQLAGLGVLFKGVSEETSLMRHAPYTWSIRQVVGHIIDCERVFGYRALRIARGDATPLESFDENAYMQAAGFDHWPLAELSEEFALLRRSHCQMFAHLQPDDWLRRGVVLGQPATVRAFAYVIVGHAQHHFEILKRRLAG